VVLKILIDSFPEIAVARFLGVVAAVRKTMPARMMRENLRIKISSEVIDRSERFPASQAVGLS
jgi:hypothetical protein